MPSGGKIYRQELTQFEKMEIPILYQDEFVVAVNKPAGLFVHPSDLDRTAGPSVMDLLRDQLGHFVYAAHRLDRKTTGVLLFSKSAEVDPVFKKLFSEKDIRKEYLAFCRGYFPPYVRCEEPLKTERGNAQEAITEISLLKTFESNIPFGKFSSSRYSLVKAIPLTGRTHQIRRHLAHLRHYLLGDSTHGETRLNAHFRTTYGLDQMFLHAERLTFHHPFLNIKMELSAPVPFWFSEIEQKISCHLS
jgi:tRNA pseudouridine65 synthase